MKAGDRVRVFDAYNAFLGNATVVKVLHFDKGSVDTWYAEVKFDGEEKTQEKFVRARDIV